MKCECGRFVGDLRGYRRCCAAAYAVRAWKMFGREASDDVIARVEASMGGEEAEAVRAKARTMATQELPSAVS